MNLRVESINVALRIRHTGRWIAGLLFECFINALSSQCRLATCAAGKTRIPRPEY
jgi:hypothetical protein